MYVFTLQPAKRINQKQSISNIGSDPISLPRRKVSVSPCNTLSAFIYDS